jgi:hypothetical protein
MSIKFIAKKVVALTLIINAMILLVSSIQETFWILSSIQSIDNSSVALQLHQELFKKAIILSSSLLIDSFYGFSLLIKPANATKIIHIILGIAIFVASKFVFQLTAVDQLLNDVRTLLLTA